MLPFFEHQNLYNSVDRIAFNYNTILSSADWFGGLDGFEQAAQTTEPLFLCPSDDLESVKFYLWGSQPVFFNRGGKYVDGMAWVELDNSLTEEYGPTNYLGCGGAHSGGITDDSERRPYTGLMSSRQRVRLGTNSDGSSSTILYGETIGGIGPRFVHTHPHGDTGRRAYPWISGGLARGRGDADWKRAVRHNNRSIRMLGDSEYSSPFGFGSKHALTVNFAMADGSVRGISRDISWQTLYALCGANDGQVVDE